MESLSANQLLAIVITERVGACVSLISSLFVIAAYASFASFRKPINSLVFFAAFSSIGMTYPTLVSESGPNAGQQSALCLSQAFAVQMFLGVDATWSLCMAVNVYLAFFRGWTTKNLTKLHYPYLLFCYGISGVPALVYLVLSAKGYQNIYGPAIIWCWIDIKYDAARIGTLYAIVWLSLLIALTIYCVAGRVIWKKRHHIKGNFLNPLNENFLNTVTTTIDVSASDRRVVSMLRNDSEAQYEDYQQYTVEVETQPEDKSQLPAILHMPRITREVAENEVNPDAWLYARSAVLYFLALLLVWVPSSINRIYALVHPEQVNFGLNYVSSLVFSLQGLFYAIVFCVTNQTACSHLYRDIRHRMFTRKHSMLDEATKNDMTLDRFARRTSQRLDSDINSITSLAGH
ncbi:hypothetical protein MMC32_003694 [Xylographa parallela]|nr:hypothetical protein [Xylographa parallela]